MTANGRRPEGRRQLTLVTVGSGLALTLVLALALRAILASERAEALAMWSDRLAAAADDRRDSIESWLEERGADAQLIAAYPSVVALFEGAGGAAAAAPEADHHLSSVLIEVVRTHRLAQIRLLDTNGRARLLEPAAPLVSVLDVELARRTATEDRVLVDLRANALAPGALMTVSAPVRSYGARRPRGVVQVAVSAGDWLYPLLQRFSAYSESSEALVAVAEGDEAVFASPLRFSKLPPFQLRRPLTAPEFPVAAALAGVEEVRTGIDYREARVLAAARRIAGTRWSLVVKADLDEVLAGFRAERRALLLGAAGVAVALTLLVGLVMYRHLAHARAAADEIERTALRRIDALAQAAPSLLVELDGAGRILFINQALEGLAPERLVGSSFFERLPEGPRETMRREVELALAGERRQVEYELPGSDRAVRSYVATLVPHRREGAAGVLLAALDVTRRAAAERRVRLLDAAIEQAEEAVVVTDAAGSIEYVNASFERTSGFSRDEVIGRNPRILRSGVQPDHFYRELWETIQQGWTWRGHLVNRHKNGSLFEEVATISPVRGAAGAITNYVAVKRNVTHERQLERELQQTRRLEALGRLAGGIAHDFNNALAVIVGYAEAMLHACGNGDPRREDLSEILAASERAAGLTRQLLQFGRKAPDEQRSLDPNAAVRELVRLLGPLLGEDVTIVLDLEPGCGSVRVDPSSFDQLITNLALNGRDAMPGGGRLHIASRSVVAADDEAAERGLTAGDFVRMTVADEGTGMDAVVVDRAFEPFFTTKGPGEGTGLGLSTVYGIVQRSGGRIQIESAPGSGTRVDVYLPRIETPTAQTAPLPPPGEPVGGGERLLVVEDQESLRKLLELSLGRLGYAVVVAANAEAAEGIVAARPGEIDLLVTDVVLPGRGGPELAASLAASLPGLKVLFMSGYPGGRSSAGRPADGLEPLLAKPFTAAKLATAVRAALDGPPFQSGPPAGG